MNVPKPDPATNPIPTQGNNPANDNGAHEKENAMNNPKQDPARTATQGNNEHANDNDAYERGDKAIVPALAASALASVSLAALVAALNNVDIAAVAGRSGLPLMQFKSREDNGTWSFGQRRTTPQNGSRWAINPTTYVWGYVCFGDKSKVLGERLVSVSQPKPEFADLPDKGFPWQEQWGVNMKCLDGADAGVEVVFKSTTVGGLQALAGSVAAVRDRLNGGQYDNNVSPIVLLEKDSYPHPEHGRIWYPLLTIVAWMPLSGPAPAPAGTPPAAPPPAEQPRRRRVA
jgi:hypothetical protein